MKEAAAGNAWTLEQSRTANPVNEITNITNAVGPAWATPAYDPAGNMTTIPQPKDSTKEYKATYDAWNRLVKLEEDDGNEGLWTVQENQYDGRRFRTVRKDYEEGALAETRHFYHTADWQDIEERLGADPDEADPDRQFIWGLRYIDDCVLRDRDTNTDGTLDERLYACQDANWNVTAITDDAGDVQERYTYSSYGALTFLTPSFGPGGSAYQWEAFFTGQGLDRVTAIYYYRARYYHPGLGAFVSRDHVGYVDGSNLYQYVRCNPIASTDPSGLVSCVIYLLGGHTWSVRGAAPAKLTKDGELGCEILRVGFVACRSQAEATEFAEEYNATLLEGLPLDADVITFEQGVARFETALQAAFAAAPKRCGDKNCKGDVCEKISIATYCDPEMRKQLQIQRGRPGVKKLCDSRHVFNCKAQGGTGRWDAGGP